MFASIYNTFLDSEYLSNKVEYKVDENGMKWMKMLDWVILQFDMSKFDSPFTEHEIQRSIIIQEKFGGKEGFEGIAKIRDHGWKD
jgi:hypothetical protein